MYLTLQSLQNSWKRHVECRTDTFANLKFQQIIPHFTGLQLCQYKYHRNAQLLFSSEYKMEQNFSNWPQTTVEFRDHKFHHTLYNDIQFLSTLETRVECRTITTTLMIFSPEIVKFLSNIRWPLLTYLLAKLLR